MTPSTGTSMTVYGVRAPGAGRIARWAARAEGLTPAAHHRASVLDWLRAHRGNVSKAARHFGLARTTVQRWAQRLARAGPVALNDRSRRPRRMRAPTTPPAVVAAVVALRQEHPAWSKYKLARLLRRDHGQVVSASTVGRILSRHDLVDRRVARKRQRAALHPKRRFPSGLTIRAPGDLVQVDVKVVVGVSGATLYQFTAIDVLTKRRVLRVYPTQSSLAGALFLHELLTALPFPVRAIQSDNGAPFLGLFQRRCAQRGIPQYFTHPRSPKENSYVERSHGADEAEFYSCPGVRRLPLRLLDRALRAWEVAWNTVRPHQALDYRTPDEYLATWRAGRLPTRDCITLQT
jgi:transposase InsO family protein